MFGDLPNWAIVIDPAGKVHLKLPWTDPSVLDRTLVELDAAQPEPRPTPRDAGFLAAITQASAANAGEPSAAARHDRHAMLAHLVEHHPEHPDRAAWLDELAAEPCPPPQRAWVARQREAPRTAR